MGVVILINKTDNAEPSFNRFLVNLLYSLHVCFWGRVVLVVGQSINSSKLKACQFSAIKSAPHYQGAGLTHHVLPFFEQKAWKRLSCAAKMGFEKAGCLGGQKEQAQDAGAEQVWSPSAEAESNNICSAGCTSHWQKTIWENMVTFGLLGT